MDPLSTWRQRARMALEAYFHSRTFPRGNLSLVLGLTGGAGLLASVCLLRLGGGEMWIRYPVAECGRPRPQRRPHARRCEICQRHRALHLAAPEDGRTPAGGPRRWPSGISGGT